MPVEMISVCGSRRGGIKAVLCLPCQYVSVFVRAERRGKGEKVRFSGFSEEFLKNQL